ncbi:MAG: hypothetical protein RQ736_10730 [Thiogranum sp.]|nr:hypothetical protein [Thiogranum sp.]
MSRKIVLKPVAAAIGAAFVTSLAGASVAHAAENPFAMTELSSGYTVADAHMTEGKCGEGKCGEAAAATDADHKETAEGKCGEGKCGEAMKDADTKEPAEGKCGEGKCGGAAK